MADHASQSRSDSSTVTRSERETLLSQRGLVVWLYGLSGSGKTSLASALERSLQSEGRLTTLLDGDNLRGGLNQGLGFTVADRTENIRRAAEVAKLFAHSGVITVCAFITPTQALRDLARSIIGPADFLEVYVACSFAECERRDVKGLYAKAKAGGITHFTGKDSVFEPSTSADLILDTEKEDFAVLLEQLVQTVRAKVTLSTGK
ncbi:MAG: adenylyl-sulfate kinase [Cephaloticoccus sp.]|nr:adenylyl-sulfate kinase [Cephaloticoccus sp.]MCF7761329.1 adenylyl-sulfate kinase [Cephaloticoccus sp.]